MWVWVRVYIYSKVHELSVRMCELVCLYVRMLRSPLPSFSSPYSSYLSYLLRYVCPTVPYLVQDGESLILRGRRHY